MKKEGVVILGIFLVLFIVLLLVPAVRGACITTRSSQACFTAGSTRSDNQIAINNKFCAFDPPGTYSCTDDAAPFPFCCELSNANSLGGAGGFATTEEGAKILRTLYVNRNEYILCYPGAVQDDGKCDPGNPNIVSQEQITAKNPAWSGDVFCGAGKVVCESNFKKLDFIDTTSGISVAAGSLISGFSCCTLDEGVTIDDETPTLIPVSPPLPTPVINYCGDGEAVCGFQFGRTNLDLDSFQEVYANSMYCCKLNNVRVKQPASFTLTSELQGKNKLCFPNEVICGATMSPRDNVFSHQIYSSVQCCEAEQCNAAPDCGKPDGDANCDGKTDKEEEICKQEGDDDGDGVKNKDDKCPATVSCTLPAGQQCNPAASNCAQGLVCNPNTRVCVPRANNAQPGPCNREEEKTIIQDESSEFLGCSRSQVAAKADGDSTACELLGFETVVVDGKNVCCGDENDYFKGTNQVCLGQQVITGTGRGGGIGTQDVVFSHERRITVTPRTPDTSPVNSAPLPLVKEQEYLFEFFYTIDGRSDPETSVVLRMFDQRNIEILRHDWSFSPSLKGTRRAQAFLRVRSDSGENSINKIFFDTHGGGAVSVEKITLYRVLERKMLFSNTKLLMCLNPVTRDADLQIKNQVPGSPPGSPLGRRGNKDLNNGCNNNNECKTGYCDLTRPTGPENGRCGGRPEGSPCAGGIQNECDPGLVCENGACAIPGTSQRSKILGPLIDETRDPCKSEGAFYCDLDGLWQSESGQAERVTKSIPTNVQFRTIDTTTDEFKRILGIFDSTTRTYVVQESACCPETSCWTGSMCIGGFSGGESFTSVDGQTALFCSRGTWIEGTFKQNQYENGGRICPDNFCAYKTTQGHDCRPNGFVGPAVDGAEGEDVFCDAGTWTSRPAKIAQILTTLPGIGSRYSLYCDTPENVLVNTRFSSALPGDTTQFIQGGGVNYACVLEYNTHAWKDAVFKGLLSELPIQNQNVIVALALKNADAITNVDAGLLQSLDPAFGATDMVDGVTQLTYCMAPKKYFDDPFVIGLGGGKEEFIGCTGVWNAERAAQHHYDQGMIVDSGAANLWFNNRLNTVLYSPKAFKVE